jgi:hypothetical protein
MGTISRVQGWKDWEMQTKTAPVLGGDSQFICQVLFEAMAECSLNTVHVMKSVYIHQCEPGNILFLELGILSRKFDLFASSVRCGESCYFVFPAQTLESPWMHVAQRLPLPALAA